jgi:tRNA pseudouridine38-40 synthase
VIKQKFFYLIHIQYLGFRLHGWAKQPQVKTVHSLVDKTMRFVLGHTNFKTLGTSRTDALVSANHSAFELFLNESITDIPSFLEILNLNLPPDIKALRVEEVDKHFNIINTPKTKNYEYLFSFGAKPHPFSASIMSVIQGELDISLMQKGADLFLGTHNFGTFCTKPSQNTQFTRTVTHSKIIPNTKYSASFFPSSSYIYQIRAKGFMRNQVRLMMGQLILLGKHEISVEDLETMLVQRTKDALTFIAPASGLILDEINFEK